MSDWWGKLVGRPALPAIPVVESPFVPKGTVLIGDFAHSWVYDEVSWTDWPWTNRTYPHDALNAASAFLADVAADQRDLALEHLGAQLDELAVAAGLDPKVAWREPKARARDFARHEVVYRHEARLALTIHRPEHFVVATFTP